MQLKNLNPTTILALYECIRNDLDIPWSIIKKDNYKRNIIPMVINYLKNLAKFPDLTEDNMNMLECSSLVLLHYVVNNAFENDKITAKNLLEIEYGAKKVSRSLAIRKYILDYPNSPALTLLLASAFENDTFKTVEKRKAQFENMMGAFQ